MLHRIFKVLADPTRLRTLNLPIKAPLCVCDLEYVLQLPQSLISCQVAYLKIAGLVDGSSPRHASAVTRSVLAPRIKQGLENFLRHALSLDETCQELALLFGVAWTLDDGGKLKMRPSAPLTPEFDQQPGHKLKGDSS